MLFQSDDKVFFEHVILKVKPEESHHFNTRRSFAYVQDDKFVVCLHSEIADDAVFLYVHNIFKSA